MKINSSIVVVGVVFALALFLSLGCGCMSVSPYYKDNLFPKYFKYENFAPLTPADFDTSVKGNASPKDVVKVEGFEGLQSSAIGVDTPIDVFSTVQGNANCAPASYSNSLGYLCLDDKLKKLLTTRGGNSTGKDFQIGN